MLVHCASDFPVTDSACKTATGKTLRQWFAELDGNAILKTKRREAIQWMYDRQGRRDIWWPTTIWVEYERAQGIVNRKDGLIEGFNICVTKTIAAPVKDVYQAWCREAVLRKWMGASMKASVKDGGVFDDGDGHTGEFTRVRRDKDLRFVWRTSSSVAPTLVDVSFKDSGKEKTGLTLMHQRIQSREEADGLRKAWIAAFDALKTECEG